MSFIFLLFIMLFTVCCIFLMRSFALDYFLNSLLCDSTTYTINAFELENEIEYIIRCLEQRHRQSTTANPLIYVHCGQNENTKKICALLNKKYNNIEVI